APIAARLREVREAERRATDPAVQARLRERESELEAQLDPILAEQAGLRGEAASLKRRAAKLRRRAAKLGAQTIELADDAAAAVLEGVGLVRARNQLQLEAANAKVEAAQLEVGKANLETLQVKAGLQQQKAEKLKTTLTDELTAAGGDERGTDPRLVALQDALGATVGVQLVSPPDINKAGDASIFTVIPKTDPADDATAELVTTIRDYVIPQSTAGTDLDVHVGGQTASYVDLAAGISSKLGLVIFAVIALGFLVLMMAFRSIVIPAQAALANVLSVMAAFGVVTAVFQYGWGLDLVGIDTASSSDPIASFVPLIMFAVLFGLSMDYQVFLMSWIEYNRPKYDSDREAIAAGLATGARVISAAALIMISVFASFILNGDPTVKQFGVGLSVGVALAATMVLLLAPALLVLAGRASWWVPAWVDRYVPHLDIEGAGAAKAANTKAAKRKGRRESRRRRSSMKL
ncbi:MAG: MMPL family transporter, partial [Solirubrobacterales bacterium]